MKKPAQLRSLSRFSVGFFIVFFLAYLFSISSVGRAINTFFTDPIQNDTQRKEVVIVGVDDASLQKLGAWPWDRSIFAKLIDNLDAAKPRTIGFDVLFLEPRSGDDLFKQALSRAHSKIVLASKLDGTNYYESFLASGAKNVSSGVANVDPESDGKVRTTTLERMVGSACAPSLSLALYQGYIGIPQKSHECATTQKYFRYQGTPIEVYGVSDVLDGRVPKEAFTNKIILIGSVSLDLEDHFVGINGEKVPGVQVHAQIVTSILNNSFDTPLSAGLTALALLVLSIFTSLIAYYAKSLRVQLTLILIIIAAEMLGGFVLYDSHIIVPFFAVLFVPLTLYGYSVLYRYVVEKRHSEYVRNLFSKYVHSSLLEELVLDPSKVKLGGERRNMTILFSDLRGFTTISESLSPEGLVDLLNGYLNAMSPIVLKHKGMIDKYIGDAIMAFWNAPLTVENHESEAVRSALEMEVALAEFNEENSTSLAIGIGINSGDVVVGNMGSDEHYNYTVMGDAVNLASRLEGMTKKYGVTTIVSGETKVKAILPNVFYRKLDDAKVKGKNTAVEFYEPMYDTEENRAKAKQYEEAYSLYQRGEFLKAKDILVAASKTDTAARALLDRVLGLIENPPEDWHGIWKWDEK